MRTEWKVRAVAIALALGALVIASHAVQAVAETTRPASYTSYSRRVAPGQTLWDICGDLPYGQEDLQDVIDRCRVDNDITDPGTLQPGKVLLIRVKK
ncbi:LysM peptidoglycan-binding domain-containing protein [Acidaminococcus sp.]|uniref:LysM peptidoglycan-binding domain-containing protein n=1 Tax=Acidaminococcus sp. TaxID=1872103 RepID=UPI003D7E3781